MRWVCIDCCEEKQDFVVQWDGGWAGKANFVVEPFEVETEILETFACQYTLELRGVFTMRLSYLEN